MGMFVEELETSVDIVALVSHYCQLKKTGAYYKALCPFPGHMEKTPSFIVTPQKQLAYCFGCHRGGGPIKFIMDIEQCTFKEAVEILASFVGKALPWKMETVKEIQETKSIYTLFEEVTAFYKKVFLKHSFVGEYLEHR